MCAVLLLVVQIRSFFAAPIPNGHLPSNFPYAFIAPADNGKPEAVKVWRGRVAPESLDEGGVRCFPVGVCRNPQCPGLVDGKAFIFARGYDPNLQPGPSGTCPKCAAGGKDPTHVETWYTPEAEAMLVKVRAALGAN